MKRRHFLQTPLAAATITWSALDSDLNAATGSDTRAAAADDDVATLTRFKTVLWPQAYRTQDVELLDRLLHDSFQMIDDEGNRSDKAGELQRVREQKWDPGSFEYRIERLDVYDGRWAFVAGTGLAEKYRYRSSNVLIKEDGHWQAVASHVSGYEERPE